MCEKCRKADEGYDLPPMQVVYHKVAVNHLTSIPDQD